MYSSVSLLIKDLNRFHLVLMLGTLYFCGRELKDWTSNIYLFIHFAVLRIKARINCACQAKVLDGS